MKTYIPAKTLKRARIHARVRKKISGDAVRPRLSVFLSLQHVYAQAVDDATGSILACASTVEKDGRTIVKKQEKAKYVGGRIAARLKEKNIDSVVFDRGGRPYHGNIKILADAAREGGLKF